MPGLSASIPVETADDDVARRYLQLFSSLGCESLQAFWRREFFARNPGVWLELAGEFGLEFDSVHGSFGDGLDLSNPDPEVRSYALSIHEQDAEIGLALGAPMVVVHPSCERPSHLRNDTEYGEENRKVMDARREPALMSALEQLAGIGEEMNCIFLVENVIDRLWYGRSAPGIADSVRSVDSPFIRMCFDTGHAHIESGALGTVAEQFAQCIDVVSYVHVHDNDGRDDSHLVPGEGSINWTEFSAVLRDAPDHLTCMIEMFDAIDDMEQRLGSDRVRQRVRSILHIQ